MSSRRVLSILSASVLGLAFAASTTAASGPADGATAAPAKAPVVVMKTSLGEIRIELNQEKAPVSVANFLGYVNKKFYDGTIFHRVISSFMIQGGGFTTEGVKKTAGTPIKNEASNGLKNVRGSIAMARTADPNSATCQFFINVVDNAALDYPGRDGAGYAVFGQVVAGMDVVDKIKAVPTGEKYGMRDVPLTNVVIESVRVE
jgi:peptidyl-prolyl cis-trans isomerase A (cyclophilin A)/peptidyl-prolyl cis-trans isomerase B (cyclophilin B)